MLFFFGNILGLLEYELNLFSSQEWVGSTENYSKMFDDNAYLL